MKIRVYYEDVDIGGVVYYANYFKFIERARSELFFSKDKSPFVENGHFVVAKLNANFSSSAKLGDLLEIKTSVISALKASVTLYQEVVKNDSTIFTCNVTLAYIGANSKPKRMPDDIKELFLTKD